MSGVRLKNTNLFRLVGLVIFAVIVYRFDGTTILKRLRLSELRLLAAGVFLLLLFQTSKAFRWQYILRKHKIYYSFSSAYFMYMGSILLGILTPGRLGDFSKILALKKDGYSTMSATSASLMDRLLDIGLVVLPGTIGFLWIGYKQYVGVVFAGGFIIFVFAFLFIKWIMKRLVPHLPVRFRNKVETTVELIDQVKKNWRLTAMIGLLLISFGCWSLYYSMMVVYTHAVHLPLSIHEVVLGLSLAMLIAAIPITIAGIGTRDAALLLVFHQLGHSTETALTFSALILGTYFLTAMLGATAWIIKPLRM